MKILHLSWLCVTVCIIYICGSTPLTVTNGCARVFEGRWLPADDAEGDQFSKDGNRRTFARPSTLAWRGIDVWRYIERLASDVAGLVALPGLAARAGAD